MQAASHARATAAEARAAALQGDMVHSLCYASILHAAMRWYAAGGADECAVVCGCVHVYIFTSACVCMGVYGCMHVCACAYVSVSICVHVCVSCIDV